MTIVVENLLTHYELQGKGKLVVLLHGWGDNSAGLAAMQRRLAAKYRVLAVDLPGFGASQAPSKAWNLDDYAAWLAAALKKLDLPQPHALAGHSNGGALAIRAVSLGTLKPKKLVLIAASGVRSRQKSRRLFLKLIAKIGNVATVWMPERYRRALRQALYGAAGSDMLVVPELQETFKRTVRQDVQADAARLKVPTLLIYAQNDRAVPPAYGEVYQRLIPDSHLEIVKGAGHFVHLDRPEQVVSLMEEFLR